MKSPASGPLMDLSQYGGACRCLLRLRENEGLPGISDRAFIEQHLSQHPEWQQRPGATDLATVIELAKELRLAESVDVFRDYDRVREEHRAGRSILVQTERAPEQTNSELTARGYVTVLETIDETGFTLWCPYVSGLAETLPAAGREWWDRWLCLGIVLRGAEVERSSPGPSPQISGDLS